MLFVLLSGDGIRYSIGWLGYAIASTLMLFASIIFIFRNRDKSALRRIPLPLVALLGWQVLSISWSEYPSWSALAIVVQLATTIGAMFLVMQFDWRQLLNVFGNTLRLILLLSLLIELVAAITGPIRPIFANFEGKKPPAAAYWWVQGNLFESDRIQGFVGNANLIAFIAVLGLVVFFVEYLVTAGKKTIPIVSMVAAASFIALAKSASMTIALVIVAIAAVVAMIAEGRPRPSRHKIYWRTIWLSLFSLFLVAVYWVEITEALGKSADASGRFEIWSKVWGLITLKPVLGWGWISHWIPGVSPYEGLVVIDKVPQYHAHNAFLDVWLQVGIIGLAIFVWLLVTTFIRVWRVAVVHTNPLYFWPLFAFMVIVTQALTESRLLVENGWLLLTLLAVKSREPFDNLEPQGLTPKVKKLLRAAKRRLTLKQ